MIIYLLAAGLIAGAPHGADKPVVGPPPTWVRPVALSGEATKPDGSPVRFLLSDQQIALEPGRRTVYSEMVFTIQTPQGLSAGNISLPWRPETDVLTVHKLVIRRGGKLIDVLASGQTFTVIRREQNLDDAVLDGVLTANIQPEGLQVGDVIDLALSLSSSDQSLGSHVEELAGAWNGVSIGRAHLRVQWPNSMAVHLRPTAEMPAPTPTRTGGATVVELSRDNVEPVVPPKGAPSRYRVGRLLEITDLATWAELSKLMAPLYAGAAIVPSQGPLRDELQRIQALSVDPKVRAEAALSLVQDRVRYVALAMGSGGYVPTDAPTTWSRRFGDCKGKTVLLLALLHAMNIQAEPVAVSTVGGDGLDARLPLAGLMNHVLVRAEMGGRTYWLDGTRTGDTSLDRLRTPAYGWGLPLTMQGASLVRMMPPPLELPDRDTNIQIDASAGIAAPAPTRVELTLSDEAAVAMDAALASLSSQQREQALRALWTSQYDFIEVKSVSASFDRSAGKEHLSMEGEAKLDWSNGNYQTDGTDVGYRADFSRVPGPDRDAPFAVNYPYFHRVQESIRLPPGFNDLKLGSAMEVNETAGGIEYRRHAKIIGDTFSIEKTERSLVPEFAAKDAATEQARLRMLADRPATLKMPGNYVYSGKDIAAVRADVPTTSEGYVSRARIFIDRGLQKDALQDYDRAIQLDPNNVYGWANRGITRVQVGDLAGAKSDLVKAESIDPTFVQNAIGRGMLADAEHRPADAVIAYTQALQREPENSYARQQRASAYILLGQTGDALADLSTAVDKNRDDPQGYLDRGDQYLDLGRYDEALADFDKAATLAPDNVAALSARGLAHVWKGQYDDAAKDLDAASKLDPRNAVIFRARGLMAERQGAYDDAITAYTTALQIEPGNIFALGRRAGVNSAAGHDEAALRDAGAALALQPNLLSLRSFRAGVFFRQHREAEALQEAASLEKSVPQSSYAFVAAANIYAVFHKDAEAMAAYDKAIRIKPEGYIYVNRAGHRPRADVEGRRADLDEALKLQPDLIPAVLEKATLQMNQGDSRGAIVTYNFGLKSSPGNASLLLGRGIAFARAGNATLAEQDFRAARVKATTAPQFNDSCWSKATAGVALQSALADCDAALAKAPGTASYLDSRAFVLLRLDRLDEAEADYDRALAKSPRLPSSLYGRAVVLARKGEVAESQAAAAAASQADPNISNTFASYGVTMKTTRQGPQA